MSLFSGLSLKLSSVLPANFPNRLSIMKFDITAEKMKWIIGIIVVIFFNNLGFYI